MDSVKLELLSCGKHYGAVAGAECQKCRVLADKERPGTGCLQYSGTPWNAVFDEPKFGWYGERHYPPSPYLRPPG